jgi:hypothetical protein
VEEKEGKMVAGFLACSLTAPCGAIYTVQYTSEFADRAEAAATAGQEVTIHLCGMCSSLVCKCE